MLKKGYKEAGGCRLKVGKTTFNIQTFNIQTFNIQTFNIQTFNIQTFNIQTFNIQTFNIQTFNIQTFNPQTFNLQPPLQFVSAQLAGMNCKCGSDGRFKQTENSRSLTHLPLNCHPAKSGN